MRIAVVIDSSASIVAFLRLYTLAEDLTEIFYPLSVGMDIQKLNALAKKYDQVYFFTDGLFPKDDAELMMNIISNKIKIIKVGGW